METLNEEFQASNEELEALNEELQATVEELTTTNAELEARYRDNAELARAAQAEREKLAATLLGIGDALLAMDEAGKPLFQNRAYLATIGADATLRDAEGAPHPARSDAGGARGEAARHSGPSSRSARWAGPALLRGVRQPHPRAERPRGRGGDHP